MISSLPLLKVNNISKVYKIGENKVDALKNINFQLNKGELVIVMGRSGSGKTTLLNILGGLDAPTSGTIFMDGIEQKNYYIEPYATKYRREKIGFVFQSYNLLYSLTVEENVALPLVLRGDKSLDIKRRTEDILKLLGLYERRAHRPIELSGGQQQRVGLARALVSSPRILLADEPTGNLDSQTTLEILNLIVEMKNKLNQSIVLVTHDENVAKFGDRILTFNDGEIIGECKN
jgi:putative ABC transport system ATP-binding protein